MSLRKRHIALQDGLRAIIHDSHTNLQEEIQNITVLFCGKLDLAVIFAGYKNYVVFGKEKMGIQKEFSEYLREKSSRLLAGTEESSVLYFCDKIRQ